MRPKPNTLTQEQRAQVTQRFAALAVAKAAPKMQRQIKTSRVKAKSALTTRDFERYVEEVLVMWKNCNFQHAGPSHFVALFSALYEHVFKVPSLDFESPSKIAAATKATRLLLQNHFNDEPERLSAYLQWVFGREAAKVKTNTLNGWRPAWNNVLIPGRILEDYMLYQRKERR